jgi:hypothetical protein
MKYFKVAGQAKLVSQKLKFWESLYNHLICDRQEPPTGTCNLKKTHPKDV